MRFLLLLALIVSSSFSAAWADFPLIIDHKFGTTTIESQPERVVSLDYNGADNLLALGVQPVAIRYWYGDYPRTVWPWAEPYLEGTPEVLRGDLNFEQIAATEPDVIIALWSGIDQQDYEKLSMIAPVVAVPEGVGDYSLPWDQLALKAGEAVGRKTEAERQIDAINKELANALAENPEWEGKTASVAFSWSPGVPGAYNALDIRLQLLAQMGFKTTPLIDELAGTESSFAIQLSAEDLGAIDGDVIVWVTTDNAYSNVLDLQARRFLTAVNEGREVFTNTELGSAFSHASLLSLPFAIERLVPMLEAALDGDPNTHADDRP